MSALRVAILKCDTFMPAIKQQFGDVDHQFVKLLQLSNLAKVQTDTYECKQMQFPDSGVWDKYNGFIVTGSRDSVNGKEEWVAELKKNIVELDRQKRKVLGVCFGHQVRLNTPLSIKTAYVLYNISSRQ
jgi:GMP synthase-like glutamine amidotransferase